MGLDRILVIAVIVTLATAIYLPLAPKRPRCMMVYTIGEIESVKIFLNLPELPSQGREEHYQFSMKNTETEDVKEETIQFGNFNKEYDLTPSTPFSIADVIYEVCIMLYTNRPIDDIVIYYKAETIYNIEHSALKVPENLLKKEDFKGAYEAAFHIESTVKDYQSMQKERDAVSNEHFNATNSVDKKLITVSVIEIIIVLAAGIYQFISLKNYLANKQYI